MSQERKNITLIISLILLIAASLTLFSLSQETSADIDPTIFRLIDSQSIDRIVLERAGAKKELAYSGNRWTVNGIYEADRNLIDVLFATVAQAAPKRLAAQSIRDSVLTQMKKLGTKVSFYQDNQPEKQFYVWGDGGSTTYFYSEPDNTPYVMVIPGYKVYVAGIFEQDVNVWRDKRIFNFNWRNFKELTAEFPRDPKQNFTVAMTGKYFSVIGEVNIDTAALNNYLDAVSLIHADAFYLKGESATSDSLALSQPILSIRIKDVANQAYNLRLFEIRKGERTALAKWNEDFVWFDRRNILPIYKKRKDFIKK